MNPICAARMAMDDDTVCKYCYSSREQKYRGNLKANLEENTIELQEIIPWDDLPVTEYALERFESFGDIACRNHLINYIRICEKNPDSNFALWTKNWGFLISVFKEYKRPDNLAIVLSSPNLNEEFSQDIIDRIEEVVHIDTIFTVYGKEEFLKMPEEIRCDTKCIRCRRCYHRHDDTIRVAERLK